MMSKLCLLFIVFFFGNEVNGLFLKSKHKSCAVAENKAEPTRGSACDACKKWTESRNGHLCEFFVFKYLA